MAGLLGCIMVAGDDESGYSSLFGYSVELFGGDGHDAVGGANGMEQVSGVDAEIGFEFNNLVDSLCEGTDDVMLTLGETIGRFSGMVFAGAKVCICQVTYAHGGIIGTADGVCQSHFGNAGGLEQGWTSV